jgi:hypothetical protein
MILPPQCPSSLYRVEVSGWDQNKSFFVENSELEWNENSEKQVTLTHGLINGAVVFLRLLQPISADRGHPVAYEAELLSTNSDGYQQFRLRPIVPKHDRGVGSLGSDR